MAIVCCLAALVVSVVFYIRARPLVFNESLFTHAHGIVNTGLSLDSYAADHEGRYPMDTITANHSNV